jgi:hypothetical protein
MKGREKGNKQVETAGQAFFFLSTRSWLQAVVGWLAFDLGGMNILLG